VARRGGGLEDCVVVDWSAASSPRRGADAIWVATARRRPGRGVEATLVNPSTRRAAFDLLRVTVERALGARRRTLFAFDFSLGYPAGAAELLTTPTVPPTPRWRAVWSTLRALVVDGEDNTNNRFEVAEALNRRSGYRLFWGRPSGVRYEGSGLLPPRDVAVPSLADNPLARYRLTERCAPSRPKSNWQLFGRGAVGGQVLTGLPYLEALKRHFGAGLAVWPFEIGPTSEPFSFAPVVFAEVWPSMFVDHGTASGPAPVRDARQVSAVADALLGHRDEDLQALFAPRGLTALREAARSDATGEEGWILGVT
jgi:precorrin-8X/cobalt-precorrin-8 methylmutase